MEMRYTACSLLSVTVWYLGISGTPMVLSRASDTLAGEEVAGIVQDISEKSVVLKR